MNVVFVDGDDWEGLYIDGTLITQGHRVSVRDLLETFHAQSRPVISYAYRYADDEWLFSRGDLPDNIAEVKFQQ